METSALTLAEAQFRECQLCEEFLSKRVRPRLEHALTMTAPEQGQTYLGLFLRALSWLRTLRKLDHPSDFRQ